MNKKKKIANKKHRKSKARLKALKVSSLAKIKRKPAPKPVEKKVLNAIKILFESIDEIEIFNKKAIYLYMREITGLNTKQIVNNLNRIRKRYRNNVQEDIF